MGALRVLCAHDAFHACTARHMRAPNASSTGETAPRGRHPSRRGARPSVGRRRDAAAGAKERTAPPCARSRARISSSPAREAGDRHRCRSERHRQRRTQQIVRIHRMMDTTEAGIRHRPQPEPTTQRRPGARPVHRTWAERARDAARRMIRPRRGTTSPQEAQGESGQPGRGAPDASEAARRAERSREHARQGEVREKTEVAARRGGSRRSAPRGTTVSRSRLALCPVPIVHASLLFELRAARGVAELAPGRPDSGASPGFGRRIRVEST